MTHASIPRFGEGFLLTRATMRWFYDHYLRQPAGVEDWRASVTRTGSLSGAARLGLDGWLDPLWDEGQAYVSRLRDQGVAGRHRHFSDQIYGFLTMGKIIRAAEPDLDEIAAALTAVWEEEP